MGLVAEKGGGERTMEKSWDRIRESRMMVRNTACWYDYRIKQKQISETHFTVQRCENLQQKKKTERNEVKSRGKTNKNDKRSNMSLAIHSSTCFPNKRLEEEQCWERTQEIMFAFRKQRDGGGKYTPE